jgi:hypothetical protein
MSNNRLTGLDGLLTGFAAREALLCRAFDRFDGFSLFLAHKTRTDICSKKERIYKVWRFPVKAVKLKGVLP